MAVIAFFTTSGKGQQRANAATSYLLGPYSALSQQQKDLHHQLTAGITAARQEKNDVLVRELTAQRGKIHGKVRQPAPVLLAGDPALVEYAIANSPHTNKYSSGVIAHATEDNLQLATNPAIAREFRELIEQMVFAGLPEQDHLILWVEHSHEGNLENHFLIPRINLRTGKHFNPHPHKGAEQDFNAIRDYLNAKYQLARPDDPARKKLVANAPRSGANRDLAVSLQEEVQRQVRLGLLCNRQAVVDWLAAPQTRQAFGISSVEAKREYVRIVPEGKTKAVRLKGAVFSQQFTRLDSVLPSLSTAQPPQPSLDALWQRVEEKIAKRRAYNIERYTVTDALATMPTPTATKKKKEMAAFVRRAAKITHATAIGPLPQWQQQAIASAQDRKQILQVISLRDPSIERRLIELILAILKTILTMIGILDDNSGYIISCLAQHYGQRAQQLDSTTEGRAGATAGGDCPVEGQPAAGYARPSAFAQSVAELEQGHQRQQQHCRELGAADTAIARAVEATSESIEQLRGDHQAISDLGTRIIGGITDNWLAAGKRATPMTRNTKVVQPTQAPLGTTEPDKGLYRASRQDADGELDR